MTACLMVSLLVISITTRGSRRCEFMNFSIAARVPEPRSRKMKLYGRRCSVVGCPTLSKG